MNNLGSAILQEIEFAEHHFHHKSRCYGKSADQSGNNWATEDGLTPFQCISGNNDFGSDLNDEAKVFGSSDTPFMAGHIFFDVGGILIVGVSVDTHYVLRLVWSTVDLATGLSAGNYSTKLIKFNSANPTISAGFPVQFDTPKIAVGTKVWTQCKNATDNATVDFLFNSHGYTGS